MLYALSTEGRWMRIKQPLTKSSPRPIWHHHALSRAWWYKEMHPSFITLVLQGEEEGSDSAVWWESKLEQTKELQQDTSPLRGAYIREKVNFLNSDTAYLHEKDTLATRPSCLLQSQAFLFACMREITQTLVRSPAQPAFVHGLHFRPKERSHINYCVRCTSLRDYWTLSMRL